MEQDEKRNNTPLLSIIIPVYNTHKYLDTLMWALKRQITDEVEIIIVDGSDEEYDYFKDYKNTYYYRIKNRTAGTSRNYGLDHSSGKYICFIDSDDIVADNYIDKILHKIKSNPNFDYCYFSWRFVGTIRVDIIIEHNNPGVFAAAWFRIWNRDFIGNTRFNEEMVTSEDWDFIMRLCGGKLYNDSLRYDFIPDILYSYFVGRNDNLCTLKNEGKVRTYLNE